MSLTLMIDAAMSPPRLVVDMPASYPNLVCLALPVGPLSWPGETSFDDGTRPPDTVHHGQLERDDPARPRRARRRRPRSSPGEPASIPDALRDPDARVPRAALTRLWQLAVEATGDPCFGLEAPRFVAQTTFHALGYAVLASAP